MKKFLFLVLVLTAALHSSGQNKAITFQDAEKQGIPFQHLDSLYKSAVHSDVTLSVFKTAAEQANLRKAYVEFLQSLGAFLKTAKFKWEKETRCVNRIYFNKDGTVDHFLYDFPPGQIEAGKQEEFNRLLNLFIMDFKFALTANEKFAQCSPVKYSD